MHYELVLTQLVLRPRRTNDDIHLLAYADLIFNDILSVRWRVTRTRNDRRLLTCSHPECRIDDTHPCVSHPISEELRLAAEEKIMRCIGQWHGGREKCFWTAPRLKVGRWDQ